MTMILIRCSRFCHTGPPLRAYQEVPNAWLVKSSLTFDIWTISDNRRYWGDVRRCWTYSDILKNPGHSWSMFPYWVFIFSVRVRCSSPRLVSWQLLDPRVSCPIPDPKTPEPNPQTPDISRHLQSPTPRCQTRKSKLHSPSTVPHRT